jgi:hypothetical protein
MYRIGADPELFLQDKSGKFISAVGKFGGTKEQPRPLLNIPGYMVQEDNVAVEFNIPPQLVGMASAFSNSIRIAMNAVEAEAHALKLSIAVVASAEFEADQLVTPAARRFGCDPDFNVWSLKVNPPPRTKNKALRSAGGHVHIGGNITDKIGLGRACDLFLGCPSVLFDSDRNRRLLYGKAGAIRDKPYGIEYRTLSNFWVKSKELAEMIHNQVVQAINWVEQRKVIPEDDGRKIIRCINDSDQDILRELTEKYSLRY